MNILDELKWKYSSELNKKIGSKVRNFKEINKFITGKKHVISNTRRDKKMDDAK